MIISIDLQNYKRELKEKFIILVGFLNIYVSSRKIKLKNFQIFIILCERENKGSFIFKILGNYDYLYYVKI